MWIWLRWWIILLCRMPRWRAAMRRNTNSILLNLCWRSPIVRDLAFLAPDATNLRLRKLWNPPIMPLWSPVISSFWRICCRRGITERRKSSTQANWSKCNKIHTENPQTPPKNYYFRPHLHRPTPKMKHWNKWNWGTACCVRRNMKDRWVWKNRRKWV